MFDKSSYLSPTSVPTSLVTSFTDRLEAHLARANTDISQASETTLAHVRRSVPPKTVKFYSEFANLISLLAFEVGEVGGRIRRYQFIERYRFGLDPVEPEMGHAFLEHSYELRTGQIYAVMERGVQVVRFCASVAGDLGLGDGKAANRFLRTFRSRFDRRLRERHRQAHAHERPSMASRIVAVRSSNEAEKELAAEMLGSVLGTMMSLLTALEAKSGAGQPLMPREPRDFIRWYLSRVDQEAELMWSVFSSAIAEAAGLPPEGHDKGD